MAGPPSERDEHVEGRPLTGGCLCGAVRYEASRRALPLRLLPLRHLPARLGRAGRRLVQRQAHRLPPPAGRGPGASRPATMASAASAAIAGASSSSTTTDYPRRDRHHHRQPRRAGARTAGLPPLHEEPDRLGAVRRRPADTSTRSARERCGRLFRNAAAEEAGLQAGPEGRFRDLPPELGWLPQAGDFMSVARAGSDELDESRPGPDPRLLHRRGEMTARIARLPRRHPAGRA